MKMADPRGSVFEFVVVARVVDLHVEVANNNRVGLGRMVLELPEDVGPRVGRKVHSPNRRWSFAAPGHLDGDFNGAAVNQDPVADGSVGVRDQDGHTSLGGPLGPGRAGVLKMRAPGSRVSH